VENKGPLEGFMGKYICVGIFIYFGSITCCLWKASILHQGEYF